ncbi:MAG: hypothetical protein J5518_11235 [Lachnospiraceae bacterium]|nr:hypothetical protein [Lachnospiraceae bacterium]
MDKLSVFSEKANMPLKLAEVKVGCDINYIKPDSQWFDRNWSNGAAWSNGNTWGKGWLDNGWNNGGK